MIDEPTEPDVSPSEGEGEGEDDNNAAAVIEEPPRLDLGVPAMQLLTPATGVGVRPELAWEPVQGAQRYSLTLHREDEAAAYWAWSGTETTVRVGPTEDLSVGGAHVEPGMTWWVVAFDETGTVVAQSGERPIAP